MFVIFFFKVLVAVLICHCCFRVNLPCVLYVYTGSDMV